MKNFDIILKIRKMVSLAEHPETPEHEVNTAKKHIEILLSKYNLTIENVLEEKVSRREFRIKNTYEHTLLHQIIVNNVHTRKPFTGKYKKYKIIVADLTDAEFINVSEAWSFHRKLFKRDMDVALNTFVNAYIVKHDIYSSFDEETEEKPSKMSFEEIMRIRNAMANLSNESYFKKISNS